MTKRTKAQQAAMAEARAELLKILKPGDTVLCVLRNVSSSGMMRQIDFFVLRTDEEGTPYNSRISHLVATALDYRTTDQGALKVGGCGMDMGFHVVYTLGATLWPKGTDKPHGHRNGEPDNAGGYALRSRWL